MESYDFDKLSHEELVLIVSSTFGSGEPPSNGEDFAKKLVNMRAPQYPTHGRISVVLTSSSKAKQKDTTEPLSAIKYVQYTYTYGVTKRGCIDLSESRRIMY